MPCPTIHEFACIANACYHPTGGTLVPNFTRMYPRSFSNGFKGSVWQQGSGGSMIRVVAIAGTDMGGPGGIDPADLLADAGFAGRTATAATYLFSPAAALTIEIGRQVLESQFRDALSLTRESVGASARGSKSFIVGHSLGGGLAQMVAAELGMKGMAFNAPTTSQLGYSISPASRFLCVNQYNDPVSLATKAIGSHLGEELIINNGTSGMAAHSMDGIVSFLGSTGGNYYGQQQRF